MDPSSLEIHQNDGNKDKSYYRSELSASSENYDDIDDTVVVTVIMTIKVNEKPMMIIMIIKIKVVLTLLTKVC